MIEYLLLAAVLAVTLLIPVWYVRNNLRHGKAAKTKLDFAVKSGLIEPVSLHPKINIQRCIGTAACSAVCPEGDILGVIKGRAILVSPTKCIGHGACQLACPVDAISLVFGTERRGVELPHVKETFETNVDGIYIAGELGGMGLIRNAVTQGREAVEYIAKRPDQSEKSGEYDLIIVGGGPAGLSATLQAKKEGLNVLTLEQAEDFGGTVLTYPRRKLVMTQPMELPLYGKFNKREIQKEELIELWHTVVGSTGIQLTPREKVESIERTNGCFTVSSTGGSYTAGAVLLAIGRRGTPRKLGVPGEKSTKVAYKLLDPEQFRNMKILVVGGGDSAIEAALALSEEDGTEVSLSYRKPMFSRIKEKNQQRIDQAIEQGRVRTYFESQAKEITPTEVVLSHGDKELTLPNDFVFVLIGGEAPSRFLKSVGIEMVMKHGQR